MINPKSETLNKLKTQILQTQNGMFLGFVFWVLDLFSLPAGRQGFRV